jgi:hypothetical protein
MRLVYEQYFVFSEFRKKSAACVQPDHSASLLGS